MRVGFGKQLVLVQLCFLAPEGASHRDMAAAEFFRKV